MKIKAEEFYNRMWQLDQEIQELCTKLKQLRTEKEEMMKAGVEK